MKKFIFAFILGIISVISFSSCNYREIRERNNYLADSLARVQFVHDSIAKAPYNIINMVDSALIIYPNALKNQIQLENFGLYCFMETTTNMNYIAEIPLEYKMMQKYGNKYILKFESPSNYSSNKNNKLKSNKSGISVSFNLFVKVSNDIAEKMIEGKKYYLNGEYDSNKLTLASGNTYKLYGINFSKYDNELSFEFVMKNTKISEAN